MTKYTMGDLLILNTDLGPFYTGQEIRIINTQENTNTYDIESVQEPILCLSNISQDILQNSVENTREDS